MLSSLDSESACCIRPATRISKNSSRFELTIARNLTRSSRGLVEHNACSNTRRLKFNQLCSRLAYALRPPLSATVRAMDLPVGAESLESFFPRFTEGIE